MCAQLLDDVHLLLVLLLLILLQELLAVVEELLLLLRLARLLRRIEVAHHLLLRHLLLLITHIGACRISCCSSLLIEKELLLLLRRHLTVVEEHVLSGCVRPLALAERLEVVSCGSRGRCLHVLEAALEVLLLLLLWRRLVGSRGGQRVHEHGRRWDLLRHLRRLTELVRLLHELLRERELGHIARSVSLLVHRSILHHQIILLQIGEQLLVRLRSVRLHTIIDRHLTKAALHEGSLGLLLLDGRSSDRWLHHLVMRAGQSEPILLILLLLLRIVALLAVHRDTEILNINLRL